MDQIIEILGQVSTIFGFGSIFDAVKELLTGVSGIADSVDGVDLSSIVSSAADEVGLSS